MKFSTADFVICLSGICPLEGREGGRLVEVEGMEAGWGAIEKLAGQL